MKNSYAERDGAIFVTLARRSGPPLEAIVDPGPNFDLMQQHEGQWFAVKRHGTDRYYVQRYERQPHGGYVGRYLHLDIMKPKPKYYVQHLNGNGLDCRMQNLRAVPKYLVSRSPGPNITNNSSFLRWVTWDKNAGKWKAQIVFQNRKIHVGLFDDMKDGFRAAQNARAELEERAHMLAAI